VTRSVLFVLDIGAGKATVQVRGYRFEKPLRDAGWDVELVDVKDATEDEIVEKARRYAVVYLVKVRSFSLVKRLKAQGSKVVFDLTDPLWEFRYRRGGWWDVDRILIHSDAVFSENEYVCAYGRRYNDRVISIPVCTQVERFAAARESAPPAPPDRVVIGWVGSPSTVHAVTKFQDVLEEVCRRHPEVEIRLLGTGTMVLPTWRHARVTTVETYDEDAMIREILAMHIGIFPPPEDEYDYRVRGSHKALLYMTAGIASVALNAGDCATKIRDGVTGMLANNREEWIEKLSLLVRDPALRDQIAARGAEVIRAEHSLANVTHELSDALDRVIRMPPRTAPGLYDRARARLPREAAKVEYFVERARGKAQRGLQKLRGLVGTRA
jgi:glycosyltransferase involved in cell wall biosynthesis